MQACSKLPVIQAPVAAFDVRLYRDLLGSGIQDYLLKPLDLFSRRALREP